MTRISKNTIAKPSSLNRPWLLQDAKARFSELVRLANSQGPQLVTVHGREAVVVIDAKEFHRSRNGQTGQALIDALQNCPPNNKNIAPSRSPMPVRKVSL